MYFGIEIFHTLANLAKILTFKPNHNHLIDGGTKATSRTGPELPLTQTVHYTHHALVSFDDNWSMLIGGLYEFGGTRFTYYFDHEREEWIDGPTLEYTRYNHAAGAVTDEQTSEKLIIVTGGIEVLQASTLTSTEILIDNVWHPGTLLPSMFSNTRFINLMFFF